MSRGPGATVAVGGFAVLAVTGLLLPVAVVALHAATAGGDAAPWHEVLRAPPYPTVALRTLRTALVVTAGALPVALAIAYGLRRCHGWVRAVGVTLLGLPLLLNLLVVVLAWMLVLERRGLVNWMLQRSGLTHEPVTLLFTPVATYLAMSYVIVPVLALLLLRSLLGVSASTVESARLLGASRGQTVLWVELGQVLPSIVTSAAIALVISVNLFLVPEYLTGPGMTLLPFLVQQSVLTAFDLRAASLVSSALLAMVLGLVSVAWAVERRLRVP